MSTIGTIESAQRPKAAGQSLRWSFDTRVYGLLLIVALLLLWEVSARLGWIVSSYWPPVSLVILAALRGLAGGDVLVTLLATLRRAAIGYASGGMLGIVLGLLLGMNRWLRYAILPLVEIVRPIPTPAVIPPLILFLGVDDALKIFIIALASFFPVFTNAYSGVSAIDDTLLQLPATLPAIAAGLRTATSLALVVAVISEMIAGSSGIGYFLVEMQYALRPDLMYAAVIYLAVTGYTLNRLFLFLEARFIPWLGKA